MLNDAVKSELLRSGATAAGYGLPDRKAETLPNGARNGANAGWRSLALTSDAPSVSP
jgi:hypothetical protein